MEQNIEQNTEQNAEQMIEQKWANATITGVVGLCCGVLPLCALNLGWIPSTAAPLLIPWLIISGFTQFIGGLINLKRGDVALGSALMVFGLLLTLTPGIEVILTMTLGITIPPIIQGYAFIVLAIYGIAFMVVLGLASWFLFVAGVFLDLGLWLVALANIGCVAATWATYGWVSFFIFTLCMIYTFCTIYLNESFGRQVLPLGTPLYKP